MISFEEYLSRCVSPYHCIQVSSEMLSEAGFSPLAISEPWEVHPGQGYYVSCHGTMLAAFTVGKSFSRRTSFRMAAAHTDWPCLYIKSASEQLTAGCIRLQVEPYGGIILRSWLDRPLSCAGAVTLKSAASFRPEIRLVDFKEPLFVIPELAIHINREVNKGAALSPAKDMLPICAAVEDKFNKDGFFLNKLAEQLQVAVTDILSFDLMLYNTQPPCRTGFSKEFLLAPRLDNLTSAYACLKGLSEGSREEGLNIIGLYDNEEIGSRSKAGADSGTMGMLIEKIAASLGMSRTECIDAMTSGFLLSCDVAHALHPNYTEKYDSAQTALLNRGVALKMNYEQRYATQCADIGTVISLAERSHAPYQLFMNKPDVRGGSTLGSFPASAFSMPAADIGVPILAMHSSTELMGIQDQDAINTLVTEFFRAE